MADQDTLGHHHCHSVSELQFVSTATDLDHADHTGEGTGGGGRGGGGQSNPTTPTQ